MTTNITADVAHYAASTSISAIPEAIREQARLIIFDEMACSAFAQRSKAGRLATIYATRFGGQPEARILGTSARAPAPLAALANDTSGHGEEVDGAHVVGGHPGATIVHGALAMAETRQASGAEYLNAVVLGYDVGTRVVAACGGVFGAKYRHQLHADMFYGIGAAAAAARLLRLDAERTAHALALVTFQASGLCALFKEKEHLSKSYSNGQYASAGVAAALMAETGFEGAPDILGGQHGLIEAWGIDGAREIVTKGLGTQWAVTGANFKFLNAGYPIHAPVEAATALMREHGLAPADVASVHVGMPANAMMVVSNRDMHSICVQDMVCAAIARRGIGLRDEPFPDVLDDAHWKRLRPGIVVETHADLDRDQPNGRGAILTLTTMKGASHSRRVEAPRGHSKRGPVTWDDLAEKWREGLPNWDMARAMAMSRKLESVDDIGDLTAAFVAVH